MKNVYITSGDSGLLVPVSTYIKDLEYTRTENEEGLLAGLKHDLDASGIIINPPFSYNPNEKYLQDFLQSSLEFRERIMLVVDCPDVQYWRNIWGPERVFEYNGWQNLVRAVKSAHAKLVERVSV